jgi:hypothetical protein
MASWNFVGFQPDGLDKSTAIQESAFGNVGPIHNRCAELLIACVSSPGELVTGASLGNDIIAECEKAFENGVVELQDFHGAFVAQPSREMALHLCERLDVPLRERNILLVAAGYAPVFAQRRFDDPALKPARAAVEQVLRGHEPYPALAVDRAWTMVSANRAVAPLLAGQNSGE